MMIKVPLPLSLFFRLIQSPPEAVGPMWHALFKNKDDAKEPLPAKPRMPDTSTANPCLVSSDDPGSALRCGPTTAPSSVMSLLDPSLECRRITEDKSRDAVIWFYSLAGLSADDLGVFERVGE